MHSILLLGLTFLAQPAVGTTPRPVVVELRNGSRIDGDFLEEDGKFTVVRVAGGEVRFPTLSILRLTDRLPAGDAARPAVPGAPAASLGRTRHELAAPGAVSFEVPNAWTEAKIEGRQLALTDPTQSLFLGVSSVSDPISLWNLTAAIKKEYQRLYPDFALEREKFRVFESIRSWEIEFRYTKGKQAFREVQLLLDFGDAKRIFAFTTAAERFSELAPRFRAVTESFRFPGLAREQPAAAKSATPGDQPARDVAPAPEQRESGAADGDPAPRREREKGAPVEPLKIDLEGLLPVDAEPPAAEAGER